MKRIYNFIGGQMELIFKQWLSNFTMLEMAIYCNFFNILHLLSSLLTPYFPFIILSILKHCKISNYLLYSHILI